MASTSFQLLFCVALILTVVESQPPGLRPKPVQEMYSALFQTSQEILDEGTVSVYIRSMHLRIGTDDSLTNEMIARIDYCHGLLTDTNTEHCNVEYLDDVRKQLKLIKKPIVGNLKTFLGLVHRNLVLICYPQHVHIKDTMNKVISYDDQLELSYLKDYYEQWERYKKISTDELWKFVLKQLSVDGDYSRKRVIRALDQSACAKVRSIVTRPEAKSFYDFANLNSYFSVDAAWRCPEEVRDWAIIVTMCDYIDAWVRKMPEDDCGSKDLAKLKSD